jgi:hypothetical protein
MLKEFYNFYLKYFLYLLWNVCPMNFYLYQEFVNPIIGVSLNVFYKSFNEINII